MDNQESDANLECGEQSSPLSFSVGNWEIENNAPYGVILRNRESKDEFHFEESSNGWITVLSGNGQNFYTANGLGMQSFQPVLCSKEAIAKKKRARELALKGADMTEAEAKELLELSGIIKRQGA